MESLGQRGQGQFLISPTLLDIAPFRIPRGHDEGDRDEQDDGHEQEGRGRYGTATADEELQERR